MRINTQDVKCDFFTVAIDAPHTFETVINDIVASRPNVQMRNLERGDEFWRVAVFNPLNTYVFNGLFLRLRNGDDAGIAGVANDVIEDLNIEDDKALVDYFGFGYYRDLNILVCQRNRNAGGATRLKTYMERMSRVGAVEFGAVLNPNAAYNLDHMDAERTIELTVANPQNLQLIDGENSPLNDIRSLGHRSGVEKIELVFKAQEINNGFFDSILRAVRRDPGAFPKARVVGRVENDWEWVEYDLLQDMMRETIEVQKANRRIAPNEIFWAINEVALRRNNDLRAMFAAQ